MKVVDDLEVAGVVHEGVEYVPGQTISAADILGLPGVRLEPLPPEGCVLVHGDGPPVGNLTPEGRKILAANSAGVDELISRSIGSPRAEPQQG